MMAGLIVFFSALVSLAPQQDTTPSTLRIEKLVEEGHWSEARGSLRDFLGGERVQSRLRAAIQLASRWDRAFHWDRSVWAFAHIAEMEPHWTLAGLNHAHSLRRSGDYGGSEIVFLEWIGRHPSDPALRNGLGLLYQAQQDWAKAETEFRESIRLGGEDATSNLVILWRLDGKIDAGRQALEGILRSRPQSAWARNGYALWRLDRNR